MANIAQKYLLEQRGEFGGSIGGWRPAVTGTMNQTGKNDREASTFESAAEAAEIWDLCVADGALSEDLRIVEVAS